MAIINHISEGNTLAKISTIAEHPLPAKNNLSAVVAPTINDDSVSNYQVGSVWRNSVTGFSYICTDATKGAAVWESLGSTIDSNTIVSARGYGYSTIPVIDVSGSTVDINFNSGDIQILNMPENDVSGSFSNPRVGSFVLIVNHASGEHVIALPNAYFLGEAGPTVKSVILTAGGATPYVDKTVFSIIYDGTNYHISASTPATIVSARSFIYPSINTIPDATNIDLNFASGDIQELAMTTNTTISYVNSSIGGFTLIVQHHTSNAYDLTFPIGYFVGVAGKTAVTKSIVAKNPGGGAYGKTIFNIIYDGTDYYVSEAPLWA